MKTVSIRKLKLLGACTQQVELFHQLFGDRCTVSVDLCVAHAAQFDWSWAAQKLLSATACRAYPEAYATACRVCDEALATAGKAYGEAIALARKARDEAIAPARKAYDEAIATAYKAYDEAYATAGKAYAEAKARAFAIAFLNS